MDLAKLALFDVILYCDGEFLISVNLENVDWSLRFLLDISDSGSMAFEEGGTRIDDVSYPLPFSSR